MSLKTFKKRMQKASSLSKLTPSSPTGTRNWRLRQETGSPTSRKPRRKRKKQDDKLYPVPRLIVIAHNNFVIISDFSIFYFLNFLVHSCCPINNFFWFKSFTTLHFFLSRLLAWRGFACFRLFTRRSFVFCATVHGGEHSRFGVGLA